MKIKKRSSCLACGGKLYWISPICRQCKSCGRKIYLSENTLEDIYEEKGE